MSLQEILQMGGYAGYVWSSFLLTAAVLVFNGWHARRTLVNELDRARRRAMTLREDT